MAYISYIINVIKVINGCKDGAGMLEIGKGSQQELRIGFGCSSTSYKVFSSK
jgi:hypothetical protein